MHFSECTFFLIGGNVKENLKSLVQLQIVDSQMHDLEIAKGDLPETVNKLTEEVNSIEKYISEKGKALKNAQLERRKLDGLVNLSSEKLKKLQNQLYDVTTNREYDALTTEIETEKNNIENNENKILELFSFEEDTAKEIETKKKELTKLKKELKERDSELKKLIKTNQEKENRLLNERENIIVRVNKHLLNSYIKIHKYHKNGLAVVPVSRNACGGCYNTIPPQKLVEIRKMDKVIACEVCGRILVWRDNGGIT